MFTIDLSSPVLGLDEKPIVENGMQICLKDPVAVALSQHNQNPVKFFDWALSLYKTGKIVVDSADKQMLREFVESQANKSGISLTNILKAQVLRAIDASGKD